MANVNITINPARVTPLSAQEEAATSFNYKATVLFGDLITAGTGASDTGTIVLGNTPAKWYIDKAGVNIRTAFAGITAATVTVGTTTTVNAAIASTSILTAAWLPQASGVAVSTNLTGVTALSTVAVFTAAGTGGLAGLTAGALDIYLRINDTTQLP
jgi:hypothetical protein